MFKLVRRSLAALLIVALNLPTLVGAQQAQDRILVPTKPKDEQTKAGGARAERPELVLQTGMTEPAAVLAFSPDGRLLATAGFSGKTIKLWELATGRELAALSGNENPLVYQGQYADLAFSADGRTLLSFVGGALRQWEVQTGKLLRSTTLFAEASGIEAVKLSPDGRWAALWRQDKDELKIWDARNGQAVQVLRFAQDNARAAEVNSFAFSPDGRLLALSETEHDQRGDLNSQLVLREIASGRVVQTIKIAEEKFAKENEKAAKEQQKALLEALKKGAPPPSLNAAARSVTPVRAVQFSPDGRTLALVVRDQINGAPGEVKARLFESASGRELRALSVAPARGGQPSLTSLGVASGADHSFAFSPDGQRLLCAGNDAALKLFEVASGRLLAALPEAAGEVYATVFSADGRYAAAASLDGAVKLHDLAPAAQARTTVARTLGRVSMPVNSLALTPDARTLAVGGPQAVNLWELNTGVALRTLTLPAAPLRNREQLGEARAPNVFSGDGQFFAASGGGQSVKIWETRSGREVRSFTVNAGRTLANLALNHNGGLLALSESAPFRSLYGGAAAQADPQQDAFQVGDLAALPNPNVRQGSKDKDAMLSGRKLDKKQLEELRKQSEQMQKEMEQLSNSGQIGKMMEMAEKMMGSMGLGAVTPAQQSQPRGGVRLLAVDQSGQDGERPALASKSAMTELAGKKQAVFSPDGRWLAAALSGHEIRLSEAASGRELTPIALERGFLIQGLAFSADSKMLAAISMELSPGANLTGDNVDVSKLYSFKLRVWEVAANGQARELRALALPGWSNALAFSPDGRWLAAAGESVKLFELASGREARTLAGHTLPINALSFSPDGKLLVTGGEDGSAKLWSVETGEQLATLATLNAGADWLVVTPDGLFDGTPAAWGQILWRFSANIYDVAPVEGYFNEFFHPGLLADIYAGKRPRAAQDVAQKDRRQPLVNLQLIEGQDGAARSVKVRVAVSEPAASGATDPAGARDVRLFRNGTLVKVWRGDVLQGQRQAALETTLPLVAGENRLTAYAFNRDNIKSADATLLVTGAETLRRKGVAYVVAFGVNRYANEQFNLKYAVADALAFSEELQAQQTKLQQFARVEVVALLDQAATKANLLLALKRLTSETPLPAGAPAVLSKLLPAQPEDAVVIFFAGHGTAQQDRFYLIPHDLGYAGAREALDEKGLQAVLARSVSDLELEAAVEGLDAGQLLCVIDACNSGQALEAAEKRRGPMNSKGLAQLAYEKGMYILTAAQSYQAALEAAQLGHGYLSFALIEEGLKKGLADRDAKDGQVFTREWFDYAAARVPQMQETEMQARKLLKKTAVAFVPGEEQIADPAKRNVQRPRVFYRREQDAHPLVIAKP